MKPKVLITGSQGLTGKVLTKALSDTYDVIGLDIKREATYVIDISQNDARLPVCFSGCYAVVHLAADSRMDADFESAMKNNVAGTRNVFNAALEAGVDKIVFASSNHVTGGYELEEPYVSIANGEYERVHRPFPMISHETLPKSDGYYGDSKLFGEQMARRISNNLAAVVCLRIGTVNTQNRPVNIRQYATWLSYRDLAQLVELSIEKADGFNIFYGVSNNDWRFWDIENARRVIGYNPQDNAEAYRVK